jgi:hypothetical protein
MQGQMKLKYAEEDLLSKKKSQLTYNRRANFILRHSMEPVVMMPPSTSPFRKLGQKKATVKRVPFKPGPTVAQRDSIPD